MITAVPLGPEAVESAMIDGAAEVLPELEPDPLPLPEEPEPDVLPDPDPLPEVEPLPDPEPLSDPDPLVEPLPDDEVNVSVTLAEEEFPRPSEIV